MLELSFPVQPRLKISRHTTAFSGQFKSGKDKTASKIPTRGRHPVNQIISGYIKRLRVYIQVITGSRSGSHFSGNRPIELSKLSPNYQKTQKMSLAGKLRRIALDRQGLLRTDSFGRGKQATLRAIEHLGYVQIDTIAVVERAHHHVLWSRVANYRPGFLEQLVKQRKLFEYWFHAAAWLPMRDYRFALPRMAEFKGERDWFALCDQKLMRHVVERIECEGPLRARDFEDTRQSKTGWWDWKPAKQALELLFMQGELMVSRREGFQKVYDLPQRVLPDWVDTSHPDIDEYAGHLIETTLRAHGFATLKSMTYLRKGQKLRDAVSEQLRRRMEADALTSLDLGDRDTIYLDPELLQARAPRSHARLRILSPFDNAIIQRQRGRDIFSYHYQIECYVPQAKREYGYFCLPLMYRDGFVGRIDCKAHRTEKCLELKSLHLERQVDEDFVDAFCQTLASFAAFNGCEQITTGYSNPGDLASRIQSRLPTFTI